MNSPAFRSACASMLMACASLPLTASAQTETPPVVDGWFQLQLQLGLWDYTRISSQFDDPLAAGTETTSSNWQIGLASRVGLGFGYGLYEHLQLHLVLGFALQQAGAWVGDDRSDESSARELSFAVLPSLRYLFDEGRRRPYLGGVLGYLGSGARSDLNELDVSSRSLAAGLAAGAYLRVGNHFSIDPGVEIYYLRNGAQYAARDSDFGGVITQSTKGHGFRVLVTLGVSGWFGAEPPAARVSEDAAEDQYAAYAKDPANACAQELELEAALRPFPRSASAPAAPPEAGEAAPEPASVQDAGASDDSR